MGNELYAALSPGLSAVIIAPNEYILNTLDIKIQKILNSKSKTYIEEIVNVINSFLLSKDGLEYLRCGVPLLSDVIEYENKNKFIDMLMNIFIVLELKEKFLGLEILVPLFKKLRQKRDKIKYLFQNENKYDKVEVELFFKGKENHIKEFCSNNLKEGHFPLYNPKTINISYLFFLYILSLVFYSGLTF